MIIFYSGSISPLDKEMWHRPNSGEMLTYYEIFEKKNRPMKEMLSQRAEYFQRKLVARLQGSKEEGVVQTWDHMGIDLLLETVLPCNSEVEYQRALVQFGKEHARGAEMSLDEGNRLFRRRVIRRTDYKVEGERRSRAGLSFTWVEKLVLKWADSNDKESREFPNDEYLAILLQRTVKEVQDARVKCNRHGITGFGIRG